MKLFVDVGSHQGQTLEEVLKPHWRFDVIHAIEPMPFERDILTARFRVDPRVQIHPFALAGTTGVVKMYGTNDALEASLFAEKDDVDASIVTTVQALSATAFFEALPAGDIYVNLNCEGAEVPILDSLCDSRELLRISHMLVSFDIDKVTGQEGEARRVRDRMAALEFEDYTFEYFDFPTHQEQIAAWLESV